MSETRESESVERRRSPRHPAAQLPSVRARLLAGPDLEIIDISREGVLVESDVRLALGLGICLHVWSNGERQLLGGRVARVDDSPDDRRKYRAGIALDADFPLFELSARAGVSETIDAPEGGSDGFQADLTTLRTALEEQRRQEQDYQRTLEMLKAALRSSDRERKEAEQEHAAQRGTWEEERQRLSAERELAVRLAGQRDEHLATSRQREARLVEERNQWLAERETLAERVRTAEATASAAVRRSSSQEERERLLVRSIDEERAMLAGLLQEKERLFSDLEASRAQADLAGREQVQLQQQCSDLAREAQELSTRLAATEGWCADQQELIYRLRTDMLRSCALLDSWQVSKASAPSGGGEAPPDAVPRSVAETALQPG